MSGGCLVPGPRAACVFADLHCHTYVCPVFARSKALGRALLSVETGLSTVACVPLCGTCLRRTPIHYSRSVHQCAGRAVYFAAAKYGKAGRPPGVATLVAVRGLVPSGCIACSLKHRRHYFATRKTPLNTCRILQRSTKGVT